MDGTNGAPRIAPVDRATATEEQLAALEPLGPLADLHLFGTLAHNPPLLKAWLRFGGHLLQRSILPGRDRELVILRTAARTGGAYEWGQHVGIARGEGLGDDEIRRLAGDVDDTWPAWDATLIRATDQLLDDHDLDDATWAALAERYGTDQLLELTLLAGHYAMLAGLLGAARVQTERPLPAIGES